MPPESQPSFLKRKTGLPDVAVGQIWEDADWRQQQSGDPRRVRVVAVPPDVESYPNPSQLGVRVENVKTRTKSTIRLGRFRPNSTGYRLVRDVERDKTLARVCSHVRSDGKVRWTIWVDGHEHGGGIANSHSEAHLHASYYLRDIGR